MQQFPIFEDEKKHPNGIEVYEFTRLILYFRATLRTQSTFRQQQNFNLTYVSRDKLKEIT